MLPHVMQWVYLLVYTILSLEVAIVLFLHLYMAFLHHHSPPKYKNIWGKVFKNRPNRICGRQPLKIFTWAILEYFTPFDPLESDAY